MLEENNIYQAFKLMEITESKANINANLNKDADKKVYKTKNKLVYKNKGF